MVLKQAKKYNDQGIYFPVYGICLGLERFSEITSDSGPDVLDDFQLYATSVPIEFVKDPKESFVFKHMTDE